MLLLSKYSTEALALRGEGHASWQEGRWIEGWRVYSGLQWLWKGFLARVSALVTSGLGDSPSFLMRCWGCGSASRNPHAAWKLCLFIRLALGKTGRQMTQALGAHLYLTFRAGFCALWLASLSRPQFLLRDGPRFSGSCSDALRPACHTNPFWAHTTKWSDRWSTCWVSSCLPASVSLFVLFLFNRLFLEILGSLKHWIEGTGISPIFSRCFYFNKCLLALQRLITKVGVSGR